MKNAAGSSFILAGSKCRQSKTGENRKPYILYKPDGSPLEFSFMPDHPVRPERRREGNEQLFRAARRLLRRAGCCRAEKQRAHDILRLLTNASDRTARKLEHQREELARSAKREQKRIYADLINANLYAIPRGASSANGQLL